MDVKEVLQLIKGREIEEIDLRFCDLPGLWQHYTFVPEILNEDSFEDGFGFDGSSIRGFREIQESDMLVIPATLRAQVEQRIVGMSRPGAQRMGSRDGAEAVACAGEIAAGDGRPVVVEVVGLLVLEDVAGFDA